MEQLKTFASGFRMPDLSKLWTASDEPDSASSKQTTLQQLEPALIRLQELALWHDPVKSGIAVAAATLAYLYLAYVTSFTTIGLLAMLGMGGFVYTTWVNRIWPEIRVETAAENDDHPFTPLHPDCLTAPEIHLALTQLHARLAQITAQLFSMRTTNPGFFCACAVTALAIVFYIGTMVTALQLMYLCVVMVLTVPGLVKLLRTNSAWNDFEASLQPYLPNWLEDHDAVDAPVVRQEPQTTSEMARYMATSYMQSLSDAGSKLVSRATNDDEDEMKEYLPEEAEVKAEPIEEDSEEEEERELMSLEAGLGAIPDHDEEPGLAAIKTEPQEEEDFLPAVRHIKEEPQDEEDDDSLSLQPALGAPKHTSASRDSAGQVPDHDAPSESEEDEVDHASNLVAPLMAVAADAVKNAVEASMDKAAAAALVSTATATSPPSSAPSVIMQPQDQQLLHAAISDSSVAQPPRRRKSDSSEEPSSEEFDIISEEELRMVERETGGDL